MDKQTARYYQDFASAIGSRYESRSLDFLYEYASKVFPKGGKILELGCGTGRDGANLLERGFQIFSSDGSIAMLRELQHFHSVLSSRSFVCRLPHPLPFHSDCFDGCLAVAILMHLELGEIREVFIELERVLKKGSSCLVSIPTKRSGLNSEFRDEYGRLYTTIPDQFFEDLSKILDLRSAHSFQNLDVLTPDRILWTTYELVKGR